MIIGTVKRCLVLSPKTASRTSWVFDGKASMGNATENFESNGCQVDRARDHGSSDRFEDEVQYE